MRHVIPISGKDSLATALIQTTYDSSKEYEFLFNDTGAELPETYDWLDDVEKKTGWAIARVGENLEAYIVKYGGYLPTYNRRFCTTKTKITPMEKYLGKDEQVSVYYGLRADENRTGYVPLGSSKITPVYPLVEHNIDLEGVWTILKFQELTPPSFFWQRLFDAVANRIDVSGLTDFEEHLLFSGRTRANCYFCFYQRISEVLWLLETHPDYYEKMSAFEKDDYTWIKNLRLSEFKNDTARKQRAFKSKVDSVVAYISTKQQLSIPGLLVDNEIATTSCGLICGK